MKELFADKPNESIVMDLQAIVLDAVYRYEFYEKNGLPDSPIYPLYPLLILSELNGSTAVQTALTLLKHGNTILDFWLGEMWSDSMWFIFYKHGMNHLEELKAFMLEENLNPSAKIVVSSGLSLIAADDPSKCGIISDWFSDVLKYYLDNIDNNNLIDSELITAIVMALANFKSDEKCVELVKSLFTIEGLLLKYQCGEFQDWEKFYIKGNDSDYPRTLNQLFDHINKLYLT